MFYHVGVTTVEAPIPRPMKHDGCRSSDVYFMYKWKLYAVWGVLHCTYRQYTTHNRFTWTLYTTNTGPIRDGIIRVGRAPYTSPKILGGDGEPTKNLKKSQRGLSHSKLKKTEK